MPDASIKLSSKAFPTSFPIAMFFSSMRYTATPFQAEGLSPSTPWFLPHQGGHQHDTPSPQILSR